MTRSSIAMYPNRFLSIWYVPWKPFTYLASRLALSPNRPNRPFTCASSPRSTIGNFHNGFWAYGAPGHKPCTYLASKLILSPTGLKRDSIWYTSSSSSIGCVYSSIGCVQIDFWAYGMFHENHAPILHQYLHYLQTDQTELSLESLDLGVPLAASKMFSYPMVH